MISSLAVGLFIVDEHLFNAAEEEKEFLITIKQVFEEMDINKNGVITCTELKQFGSQLKLVTDRFNNLREDDWETIFKKIDLDGDDRLDINEFITAALNYSTFLSDANKGRINRLFNYIMQFNSKEQLKLKNLMDMLPTNCNPEGQPAASIRTKGPLFEKNEHFKVKYLKVRKRWNDILKEVQVNDND